MSAVSDLRNVFFTSLGCSKNLVDSQVMLGVLKKNGLKLTDQPENAEVIIVNTCSFIDLAKEESINTIIDLADYKNEDQGKCKALVVSGCLGQRYHQDLERELPEVDLIIGTGEYYRVYHLLKALEDGNLPRKSFVDIPKYIHSDLDPRINTSPFYMAWLKVSEGCDRKCTFCIIPTLRGSLRSRSVESLVNETKRLVSEGVREINIISQDLSDYGKDLAAGNNLYNLLVELNKIDDLKWVRLFYYYPDDLSDEVIELIASSPKICSYLDMPIQHFSDSVLKRMNRKITGEKILERVQKLHQKIPDIALRTSVIVGFPGETQEDFEMLKSGLQQIRPQHLGVFKYSDEEGTPSFRLKDKIDPELIEARYQEIYLLQQEILEEKNQRYVGKTLDVLVEGRHEETELLLVGRSYAQAPDIDGKIIINSGEAQIGEFVSVLITEVLGYDLLGEIVAS